MKITVGHLLIGAGIGGFVLLGPFGKTSSLSSAMMHARNFAADNLPYMDFLRMPAPNLPKASVSADVSASTSTLTTPSAASNALELEGKSGGGPVADTDDKSFAETPLTPVAAAPEADSHARPQPTAPPEPAAVPAKHRVARHRRRRHSANRAAAPAAKTTSEKKDPLVGTYVSLTLGNGHVVKGLLIERTPTHVKVQLPGMGPFDYAANTVKNIGPAE